MLGPLPGLEAQRLMAPSLRPPGRIRFRESNSRPSAVMILLFPCSDGLGTVFIHRSRWGPHGGQISLPGGRQEPADANLEETAYRETREEIGINTGSVRTLGMLTPLYVPYSNYRIQPVVTFTDTEPEFVPDSREVESVVRVPLLELFHPDNRKSMFIRKLGIRIGAPCYDAGGHCVWGATAMIMSEFEVLFISCISG